MDDQRLDTVNSMFPLDGPKDFDAVLDALDAADQLYRYANHATLGDARELLPYAGSVEVMLSALSRGVGRLPQLLGQLAQRLDQLATDPTMFDARLSGNDPNRHRHAATQALHGAENLRAAAATLRQAENTIDGARQLTSSLGHD